MKVSGHATPEGTERYRNRRAEHCAENHFNQIADLWWSSIGVGTYLGSRDKLTDEIVAEAIIKSVASGINVIDSAINYRGQRGERSIGQALKKLFDRGELNRDEIIICTKGGFIPHTDGPEWFESEYCRKTESGITLHDLAADCHCMHPYYLTDQLERSRQNLGLETLDVYYIHNPETQLGTVDDDAFYARLEEAFKMLEGAVANGKIRHYGVATWSAFRVPENNPSHISLERLKDIAQGIAGNGKDHFRFVQLPFNLMMTEALVEPTQRVGNEILPAIAAASKLGIYSALSASIAQGKVSSLAQKLKPFTDGKFDSCCQFGLQFSRSAPGAALALVGMKREKHVSENLKLCEIAPIEKKEFNAILA